MKLPKSEEKGKSQNVIRAVTGKKTGKRK